MKTKFGAEKPHMIKTSLEPVKGIGGKSQRIVTELYHLYELYIEETDESLNQSGSHFLFNHTYDFLDVNNLLEAYPSEIKNKLWRLAKISLKQHRNGWLIVKSRTKDQALVKYIDNMLKEDLKKFYKSYLVRKQLYDMKRFENKEMIIEDAFSGKEIKLMDIVVK